jgi:branched-chain amino acid transport system substrate-binding protein
MKLLCCTLLLFASVANAQILIGQTAGFTGSVAPSVKETAEGARLYIDSINEKGGIRGERIELISLDDKFDPKLAAANATTLVMQKGVIALFLTRGTPHTEAVMKELDSLRVPLIAPSTGAMSLHKPVNPWVFNVRSTYQGEARKAIGLLKTIGLDRIAVFQRDDSFGSDVMAGATSGFQAEKLTPVYVMKFDRTKPDFSAIGGEITKAQPNAFLVIGGGSDVVSATKAIRAAGSRAQIVTLSNNAAAGFVKSMGEFGPGTIVTQVFPSERSLVNPLSKEASELARRKKIDVSPALIEGFAAAKVLVEGLRRAGPRANGPRLRDAMESIKNFDLGGLEITYSASDRTGAEFTDLSIVSKDGQFRR